MRNAAHSDVIARIEAKAPKARRSPATASMLLAEWHSEGPLVHEPTGIQTLDELTEGGPVYGTRWYLMGAPDAGKTAFLVQVADEFLARGLAVGLLAVDEEPGDVLTRFMQRRGIVRRECEERSSRFFVDAKAHADELAALRLYDDTWTIEEAAADLADFAKAQGRRAFLGIDSIQTVMSRAELDGDAKSVREAVTARARAIRAAASTHRAIVFATSEMSRGAYRSVEAADSTDDMASAKESGAIEYSARVMLALRSVKDDPDLIELRIAKNKHGRRGDRIGLRLARGRQTLAEVGLPEAVDPTEKRELARVTRERDKNEAAAVALVAELVDAPGSFAAREIVGLLRGRLGSCSTAVADAARAMLGPALVRVGSYHRAGLWLDGSRLPDRVVGMLPAELRAQAVSARPRAEQVSA